MATYLITRSGHYAIRIAQVALILMALIALFYAVGAPTYQGE